MEVIDIARLRKVNELANTLSRNRLVSNKMEAADLANSLAGRRSEQELKKSVVDKNQFLVHEEQKAAEQRQSPIINYYTKDEVSNMFNRLTLQQSIENDKLKISISENESTVESSKKQYKELQQELLSLKNEFLTIKNESASLRNEYDALCQQLNQTAEESEKIEEIENELPSNIESTEYQQTYSQESSVETITATEEYQPNIVDISELEELQPETITLNDLQEEQTTYEQLMVDDNIQQLIVNDNLQQTEDTENRPEELAAEQQEQLQPQFTEEQLQQIDREEEVQQGYVEQQDFIQDFQEQKENLIYNEVSVEQPAEELQQQTERFQEETPMLNDEFILENKEQLLQQQKQEVVNVYINEDLEATKEQQEHGHEVQKKLFTNGSTAPEPRKTFHHKTGNLTSDDVSVEKMFYYGK